MSITIGDTTYCDDYETITGKSLPVVETKVVAPPAPVEVATSTPAEVA